MTFLRDQAGFSEKDLKKLDEGEAITRIVKTDDNREVTVMGAVRVDAPADYIVDRFTQIATLLRGSESTRSVGQFGATPAVAEMAAMELPNDDVSDLKKCKPEHCDVKLPANAIDVLHERVDWESADHTGQVNEFFGEAIVRYLTSYQANGNAALATYDDKKEPLSVAQGFELLLSDMPVLHSLEPRLLSHVSEYPAGSSDEIEDVFYWTVADFGLKPVLSLRHLAIQRDTESPLTDAMVVIKEIYSSHYFQAVVEVLAFTEVTGSEGAVSTIVTYMGRSRFDGKVGGLKRHMLNDKVKDAERDELAAGKARVEQEYGAAGS